MIPGELLVAAGELELNAGRKTMRITVANRGDRPIQVGSHYHFFETNEALDFARASTRGFRLNIAAGTAVRFEPGQERDVELVALDGDRVVYGFQGKVMGPLAAGKKAAAGKATAKATLPGMKGGGKKPIPLPASPLGEGRTVRPAKERAAKKGGGK